MIRIISSETDRIKAIRQFVQIVCIFDFKDVTPRELDLLCEFVACGEVSDIAKKNFLVNHDTTKANYSQIVMRLAEKGILEDKVKRNGKVLHQSLQDLSDRFINNKEIKTDAQRLLFLKWNV